MLASIRTRPVAQAIVTFSRPSVRATRSSLESVTRICASGSALADELDEHATFDPPGEFGPQV